MAGLDRGMYVREQRNDVAWIKIWRWLLEPNVNRATRPPGLPGNCPDWHIALMECMHLRFRACQGGLPRLPLLHNRIRRIVGERTGARAAEQDRIVSSGAPLVRWGCWRCRREFGQRGPDRPHHLLDCFRHAPRLRKQAELMGCGGPDLFEQAGIERRAIGDDLIGLDACSAQAREQSLDIGLLDGPGDQQIPDEPVAIWSGRVNCHEQSEIALIDFVDAQDARKLLHHPGEIVDGEIEVLSGDPTPAADRTFAGLDPEIAGQAFCSTPKGHPIVIDRLDGFLNHAVGIAGIGTQKRWLRPKVMVAG